jgi:NitT/TauT family transport system permease protein
MKNLLANSNILPISVILFSMIALWYLAAIPMNSEKVSRQFKNLTFKEHVDKSWNLKKPKLPTPHQIVNEIIKTTFYKKINSKRSLVYHGWITLKATLAGFILGTALGILLALGIVHNKAMDLSVMPWVIASQTVPILAIAPMIIVVMNSIGVTGLLPKAVISMYLSFFPVVVGMVKGLRSPDPMQLDQMKTWSATQNQTLWHLRFPSSLPYLFASLKVGIAASLIGAIVAELPSGAISGLGARMLAGTYYGQTVIIWSALFTAAILAATLVFLIGFLQSYTLKRMALVR